MRKLSAAMLVVIGLMAVPPVRAAGPYDGKWNAVAPEAGECGTLTITLTVANNMVSGTAAGKHGTGIISPTPINVDGTVQVKYGPSFRFQAGIRFSGEQFAGTYGSYCGMRDATGRRAQ